MKIFYVAVLILFSNCSLSNSESDFIFDQFDKGDYSRFDKLIKEYGPNIKDKDGLALIFYLVRDDRKLELNKLLMMDLNLEVRDPFADYGILEAAIYGDRNEIALLLIDKGISVNSAKNRMSPLSAAIYKNQLGLVDALLAKGANFSSIDTDGNPALFAAIGVRNTEIACRLIKEENLIRLKNARGMTIVDYLYQLHNPRMETHIGISNLARLDVIRNCASSLDLLYLEENIKNLEALRSPSG